METQTHTPATQPGEQPTVKFAKAWMARKRQEQQEMIDSFHTDPQIINAFQELKRQNQERGTTIVAL